MIYAPHDIQCPTMVTTCTYSISEWRCDVMVNPTELQ